MDIIGKIMIAANIVAILYFFVWVWRNNPTYGKKKSLITRFRENVSQGYFDRIKDTRDEFGGESS
ncbi:unnamed protein product [marine sediment metagenome]|uniref:Uncharacterized protein n=1 Tax=marine sediment metagenome TaxID=412755 RepID=X0VHL4_9ZZZZ